MIEKLYKIARGQAYMPHYSLLEATPENVERIHGIMLEMLDYVHEMFTKNNIRYTVAYGTLLGIIRENGFLKNDDDIDIEVHKDDWERALNVLKKIAEDKKYKLTETNSSGWYQLDTEDTGIDFVRSDNTTLSWIHSDKLFSKPTQTYRLYDKVDCNIPERTLAIEHLEEAYGKDWNTPITNYNEMKYINFWGFFIILLTTIALVSQKLTINIGIPIIAIVVLYLCVANQVNNSRFTNMVSCSEVVENIRDHLFRKNEILNKT